MSGAVSRFFDSHRKTKWLGIVVAAVIVLLVLFLTLFDWDYFRPTLAHAISQRTGRRVSIDGNLRIHLWSLNPRAQVDGLILKNPDWAKQDVMFRADRLIVSVSLLRLLRGQLVLPQVEVIRPVVDLERDAKGRASWEFGTGEPKPQTTRPVKIPTIRRLRIEDGKLDVADRIRKLILTGSLNAADDSAKSNGSAFTLRCNGSLNAKPFRAIFIGGPLINLEPEHPYELEVQLTASDIHLDSHITFPKPFDLGAFQVRFSVSGSDLADGYYLTGLALPNTPPYRMTGTVKHHGTVFHLDDLKGRLGSSDLEGEVDVETAGKRPSVRADVHSKTLNLLDGAPTLGHPASAPSASQSQSTTPVADRQPPAPQSAGAKGADSTPDRLFPDADLQLNRVRGMDADVTYHARSVIAPKMPMKEVSFHLLLKQGLLTLDPLSFILDTGTIAGRVTIDARKDVPESTIDMRIENVDLSQFTSAKLKQAPLKGTLLGRLKLNGSGSSVHKVASSANGTISVALPSGEMNAALAELTGIDVVKGLGLLLSPNQPATEVRCGVMDFQAQNGTLNSRSVFIDTTSVLITGRGSVNLGDERLDLSLQGDPKKVRFLRLRSPITLHGTLSHPVIGVKADQLIAQAGAAAALGTVLTPFAAALALIDPGLAKNKDCSAVIAEAQEDTRDSIAAAPSPSH